MPLSDSINSDLSSVPDHSWNSTLPTLTESPRPAIEEFSYPQFRFDKDTDVIGGGGNTVVYRAIVPENDLRVALKQPYLEYLITVGFADEKEALR